MDEHSMVLGPSRARCAEVTFPKTEGGNFLQDIDWQRACKCSGRRLV